MEPSRGNKPDFDHPEDEPQLWEGVDFVDLTKRLFLYADRLLGRHRIWRDNASGCPPGGVSASDLVQIAFSKYPLRRRDDDVTPFMLLAGIIRGEVAHLVDRSENKHGHLRIGEADAPGVISGEVLPDTQSGVEDELIARDLLRRIDTHFRGDRKLLQYVRLRITEQYETAREFARALRISCDEIYNMNRRLQRFLHAVRKER